jgi:hypothetical protein
VSTGWVIVVLATGTLAMVSLLATMTALDVVREISDRIDAIWGDWIDEVPWDDTPPDWVTDRTEDDR